MTALMSASAGQTEKVALYVADARSLGLTVLPPDINSSEWDFAIEGAGKDSQIRFGLGAIKNVGSNAVEAILKAREQGRFTDLNDFARRVDLRSVGKRSLECMIKVGALDAFGARASMLASLDRIVAISTNHFRAADTGQMSLFGANTGVIEEIRLPDVKDVEKREMLNWERELIGLYISDHPLNEYQTTLAQVVTHFSGQLIEAAQEEEVRVAGLITSIRPYTTKNGKAMGFVSAEDIQGTLELVLFPRTWDKYREQMNAGRIIIAKGKADQSNPPTKILVDTIKTEIKITTSAESPPPQMQTAAVRQPPVQPRPTSITTNGKAQADIPPPPENFPDDWETEWQPSFQEVSLASKPEPIPPDESLHAPAAVQVESAMEEAVPVELPHETLLPSLYVPLAMEDRDQEHPPRQITITLRSTGDHERDKRRIKTLYGTLISHHGRDKFSFQIFENSRAHLIDFPNDSTRISPDLLERLKRLIGEESWRVEEITFQ